MSNATGKLFKLKHLALDSEKMKDYYLSQELQFPYSAKSSPRLFFKERLGGSKRKKEGGFDRYRGFS